MLLSYKLSCGGAYMGLISLPKETSPTNQKYVINRPKGSLAERIRYTVKKYWFYYLLFMPVVAYYIIFKYVPMPGIQIAFKDYNFRLGIWGSPWTDNYGFKHFINFLTSGEFQRVFGNTVRIAVKEFLIGFPMPIILALLLNEVRHSKYKRFIQTTTYMPHFISYVVVYAIVYNVLGYNGLVNGIRNLLGKDPYLYMGDKNMYDSIFVWSGVWKGVGWGSIIYLAQLTNANPELYEAAIIDGAGRWRLMWHVSLPILRTLISIQIILAMGGLFSVNFTKTLVFINDMVQTRAETVGYHVYQKGLKTVNNYSYATAVGLFNSILGLILTIIVNKIAKMVDEEGGIW